MKALRKGLCAVGPVYQTPDLVEKSQGIVPGCGFEPQLLGRSDSGWVGKEPRQKHPHGLERQGGGAARGCGRAPLSPLPPPARDSLRLLALPFLAALSFRACCSR